MRANDDLDMLYHEAVDLASPLSKEECLQILHSGGIDFRNVDLPPALWFYAIITFENNKPRVI